MCIWRIVPFLLGLSGLQVAGASTYSAEDFVRESSYTYFVLSPDGRYLAGIAPIPVGEEERRNIAVIDLEDRNKSKFVTHLRKFDVGSMFWTGPAHIAFTALNREKVSLSGLFHVDIHSGEPARPIFSERKLIQDMNRNSGRRVSLHVMDVLKDDPDHMVVRYDGRDGLVDDVFRLNIKSRTMKLLEKNPGNVFRYYLDNRQQVRMAHVIDGEYFEFWYRETSESPWVTLSRVHVTQPPPLVPIAFHQDNRTIWIRSYHESNTAAVYRFDPDSGRYMERLFHHPEFDADRLVMSEDHRVLAVGFGAETFAWHGVDPNYSSTLRSLEAAFPGKQVLVVSTSDDLQRWVVLTIAYNDPGSIYLYEAAEQKLEPLGAIRPWFDPKRLPFSEAISFKARDGLTINGYLTRPPGGDPDLPLVMYLNNSTELRSYGTFSSDAFFIASRGYNVLRINPRGAMGYGWRHYRAGFGQLGGQIQDDITDAVRWAIDNDLASAGRVCIFGKSMGGYQALMALVKTPELYRCGVSIGGFADLPSTIETALEDNDFMAPLMHLYLGNPRDEALMQERSPIHRLDVLSAPVMIVHGGLSQDFKRKNAAQLRDRLDALEKPYRWLSKSNEANFFVRKENRLELYQTLDTFLAEHLQPLD